MLLTILLIIIIIALIIVALLLFMMDITYGRETEFSVKYDINTDNNNINTAEWYCTA